jgi:hypothetical protein
MKKTLKIMALALASLILLAWLAFEVIPGPVDGCWKYIYRVNCLCGDSYNFLHCEHGKIRKYASNHLPSWDWGHYEKIGRNRYRIRSLQTTDDPEILTMTVRPTLLALRIVESEPDDGGFFQKLIYRIVFTGRCRQMIAEYKANEAANQRLEATGDPLRGSPAPQP